MITRRHGRATYYMFPPEVLGPIARWHPPTNNDRTQFRTLMQQFQNVNPFGRNAGTLVPVNGSTNYRIDLQGRVHGQYLNIQYQSGTASLSCVLMHEDASIFGEWRRFFQLGMGQSFNDGQIRVIVVIKIPDDEPKKTTNPEFDAIKLLKYREALKASEKKAAKIGAKLAAKRAAAKEATELLTKLGVKNASKLGGEEVGKMVAKKVPLIGLGIGIVFGIGRFIKGDVGGGLAELASGAASTVPGYGTAASAAIDVALLGKDIADAIEEQKERKILAEKDFNKIADQLHEEDLYMLTTLIQIKHIETEQKLNKYHKNQNNNDEDDEDEKTDVFSLQNYQWANKIGGNGGAPFNKLGIDGVNDKITGIRIYSGLYVDSIQFQVNGEWYNKHGGNGGSKSELILDDDEYITKINGRCGAYMDKIKLITNKGRSIQCGGNGGHSFSDGADDSVLVDCKGRSGDFVDQLQFMWARRS